MPTFFDLQKFAATGIASPDMTAFDKARALAAFGGGAVQTLTDVPPLSFRANGKPLISWSMIGNGSQTGTPTPDNPIMPEFVGALDETDWTIPITNAGQTVPVYLGQTQTVRRIKKLVLTGEEAFGSYINPSLQRYGVYLQAADMRVNMGLLGYSTHFQPITTPSPDVDGVVFGARNDFLYFTFASDTATSLNLTTLDNIKGWFQQQYAAGTPVTVWYVLAEPETAIVNEPLCKIGDYADELHSEDAGVTITTAKGQNTLTVESELQPSSMTITYKG